MKKITKSSDLTNICLTFQSECPPGEIQPLIGPLLVHTELLEAQNNISIYIATVFYNISL